MQFRSQHEIRLNTNTEILEIHLSDQYKFLEMAPKIDARKKLEQIRRDKVKNQKPTKVKDLRQLISDKKGRTTSNVRSPNKTANGRIVKKRPSGPRDLRDTSILGRRTTRTARRVDRNVHKTVREQQGTSRSGPNINNRKVYVASRQPKGAGQIQYYVPPHMQHQQPTFIIAPPAPGPVPVQSNLAMDNTIESQRASVLITNLLPSISQNDIIELFGGVGQLVEVVTINSTTALATYEKGSDAVTAVKLFNNRELDGQVMFVNMMPNSSPASNVRSRVGHSSVIGRHPAPLDTSYGRRI